MRFPDRLRAALTGIVLLAALCTAVPLSAGQPVEPRIVASLVPEKQLYDASEGILLRFTLKNNTASTLSVLKWGTPFEGFKKDMFLVTSQGKPVPYIGILMKRGAPRREDYLSIAPGSEASVLVDLSQGYAIQSAGEYSVEFSSQLLDVRRGTTGPLQDGYQPVSVTAPPVSFVQQGEREARRSTVSPQAFTDCSTSEQNDINTSFSLAQTMATDAFNAVQTAGTPSEAARYITWFGPHNSSRYTTVENNLSAISDALNTEDFDWDCHGAQCSPTSFAYVYSNSPYKIYLCNAFWSAGNTGTDSRPGVIIHETSHFNVVADTDDHFYGHDNCIDSAQTTPADAIDNADSHEYFCEDVEGLPMGPVTDPVRVSFTHSSTEIGTEHLPYNTVGEGASAVADGGTLQIEAGSSAETLQIADPMTIEALGGTVTIGGP